MEIELTVVHMHYCKMVPKGTILTVIEVQEDDFIAKWGETLVRIPKQDCTIVNK